MEDFKPKSEGERRNELMDEALKIKKFSPGKAKQLRESLKRKAKTGEPFTLEEEEFAQALEAFRQLTPAGKNE